MSWRPEKAGSAGKKKYREELANETEEKKANVENMKGQVPERLAATFRSFCFSSVRLTVHFADNVAAGCAAGEVGAGSASQFLFCALPPLSIFYPHSA